jgi:hypothetical protein
MPACLATLAPEPLLRTGLISAHAASAVIAFTLGVLLAARRGRHPTQAVSYLIALTLMAVSVTGAVILEWHALTLAIRGIFTALLALAAYTVWRGYRARGKLAAAGSSLPGALDDLSFTLIALFTAFVVVLTGDLGGPVWLVVALGVLAVAAGRRLTGLIKARRLRREDPTGNTPPAGPPTAPRPTRPTTAAARALPAVAYSMTKTRTHPRSSAPRVVRRPWSPSST